MWSPRRLLVCLVVVILQSAISNGQLRNPILREQGIDDLDYYDPTIYNANGTRIVGGRPINIQRVPWQVVLYRNSDFICGGSVVSADWVLTAAHCVSDGGRFSVRAGSRYRNRGGQYRRARLVVISSLFNTDTYDHDIAMIRVHTRFQFTQKVSPIAISRPGRNLPLKLFVSGWGGVAYNSDNPIALRGVTMKKFNRAQCIQKYQNAGFTITANMICVGAQGKDSCHGDSGGPLVRRRIQYGIVSVGLQCSRPPGVYTNVRRMNQWIRSAVNRWGGQMPTFR